MLEYYIDILLYMENDMHDKKYIYTGVVTHTNGGALTYSLLKAP